MEVILNLSSLDLSSINSHNFRLFLLMILVLEHPFIDFKFNFMLHFLSTLRYFGNSQGFKDLNDYFQ